jgi:hypothetical protein
MVEIPELGKLKQYGEELVNSYPYAVEVVICESPIAFL